MKTSGEVRKGSEGMLSSRSLGTLASMDTMSMRISRRCFPRHFHSLPKEVSQPFLLAHMNYARLKAPLDDPIMTEFRLALEPINALAKATPGFVWSFDNDDPSLRNAVPLLREDPLVMPQLSLWTNVASLQHFAFKSGHAMYLKRKREWFTSPEPPYAVCWWRPHGENTPTLQEAFDCCQYLRDHGPSPQAFDFSTAKDYPMPDAEKYDGDFLGDKRKRQCHLA